MKRFILAFAAILSLGVGVANAQSFAHNAPPVQQNNVNDQQ